jgi:hypothetical protein
MKKIGLLLIGLLSFYAFAFGQPTGYSSIKSEPDFLSKMKNYAAKLTCIIAILFRRNIFNTWMQRLNQRRNSGSKLPIKSAGNIQSPTNIFLF